MVLPPHPTYLATHLQRYARWLLLGLLVMFHLVVLQGPENLLGRVIFVGHVGLFFLWQPFIRTEQPLAWPALLGMLTVIALITTGFNWWLLGVWLMILAGIIGGKVLLFEARWTRFLYLLSLTYLVATLFLCVLPAALPAVRIGDVFSGIGRWGAPSLLVAMAFLPEQREPQNQEEVVDFVYSVFVFLLLSVLSLGSLAMMLLRGSDYVDALFETLLAIGVVLLLLGWIWNPRVGFTGIGVGFSRYLLSIGLPVERWLHTLADLAQRQDHPDRFVAEACREMALSLPWVTGGTWTTAEATGTFGSTEGRHSQFHYGQFQLSIYTRYPLSPSLIWHFDLLAQLVGEFHADRLRVRELRYMSRVHAVHETGARLTHDIKNLLQSLRTLCVAADEAVDREPAAYVALLRRQLPAVTQRLAQTLDKLHAPQSDVRHTVSAKHWWQEIQRRYGGDRLVFRADGNLEGISVPEPLFSNVIENLLENVIAKRQLAPGLGVAITFHVTSDGPGLTVSDDGEPIPNTLVADLLVRPVPSDNGYGIGLYQAARLAALNGFILALCDNEPGRVAFSLMPTEARGN